MHEDAGSASTLPPPPAAAARRRRRPRTSRRRRRNLPRRAPARHEEREKRNKSAYSSRDSSSVDLIRVRRQQCRSSGQLQPAVGGRMVRYAFREAGRGVANSVARSRRYDGSRAEVAELADAPDSKSSGATPRAGSIPAFGILPFRPIAAKQRPPGLASRRRLGVLTGGGDCPGLNAVIRAVTRRSLDARLARSSASARAGAGSSRDASSRSGRARSPGSCRAAGRSSGPRGRTRTRSKAASSGCSSNFDAERLDALVAIGGEDTLGVAARLYAEHELPVVGVPKTIDNDLSATDYTFGFDTAVSIATEAIDRLHTTAESHNRVMVVEVMGRHTGWIAVMSGIAGGADVILIPEQPITVEEACGEIRRRHERGKDFSIVVVSEGYELTYASGEQRGGRQEARRRPVRPRPPGRRRRGARPRDRGANRLRDARDGARPRPARRLPHAARPRARDALRAQGRRPRRTRAGSARWPRCAATRSWGSRSPRRARAEDGSARAGTRSRRRSSASARRGRGRRRRSPGSRGSARRARPRRPARGRAPAPARRGRSRRRRASRPARRGAGRASARAPPPRSRRAAA